MRALSMGLLLVLLGLCHSFTTLAAQPLFTAEEQQWIARHKEIPYSFIPSWPLDYEDEGQHIGLSRDYLEAIEKTSGLRFVAATREHGPQLISAVASELLSAEQMQGWRFSQRWTTINAMVITDNDASTVHALHQLYGKRVAVRSGTFYETWLREHCPQIDLLPLNHTREVFEAVYDGRADAALGSDLVIRPLLYRYYSHKLAIAGQIAELRTGINMAVAQDQALLLSIINKSLTAIPADKSNDIFNRWVGGMKLGYPTFGVIFSLYNIEIFAFCLLLLLLGVLLQRVVVLWRKALASEQRKTQFLAMMSHEIRTPMNAMIAALELLNRPVSLAQREQYLALANSSARSLLDLLNDILDHSKIMQKGIRLERRAFLLAELIQAICDSYRPLAAQKGLAMVVSIAPALEHQWLAGDAHRVRQIVNNLLSNAIKFTASGGVSITLDGEFFPDNTCMISLAVADTGIGMTPDIQRNLFNAWMQADDAPDRHYGGSGLGLWICWQLMRLMNGALLCHSEAGRGSTFTLKLSLPLSQPAPVNEQPALPHFTDDTVILLVEDHPAAQRMLKAQLKTLGCQVDVAGNGEQALSLIADENYYDVILLDINLPDISGYEVARRLRMLEQQRGSEAMPIVAISAMSDEHHFAQSQQSGINMVLSKPIVLPALAQCLRRWCHLAPAEQHNHAVLPVQDDAELARWLQEDVEGFGAASVSGDRQMMQHYAHRLRGAAQMYQLTALDHLSTRIETTLRSEQTIDPATAQRWLKSLKLTVTSATHL